MIGTNQGRTVLTMVAAALLSVAARTTDATAQERAVTRLDLPVGRSFPLQTSAAITRVSIGLPEVADVVVISEREVVINARTAGETDAIVWQANGTRLHYRVSVHSPSDRMQIALSVKIAEVRRDVLRDIGVSGVYRDRSGTGETRTRAGSGLFRTDAVFGDSGVINLPGDGNFLTILSTLQLENILVLLEAEEQAGRARTLAEPTVLAANKETATFLSGGELPIPVVQGGSGDPNQSRVSIQYREFGIRLTFTAEIISDSLVQLAVAPEVSSLDYGNAVTISGFRVPAFRTRRVQSTVDVRRDESLIITGLYNNSEDKVRTGIPLLMHIPLLGQLFSRTTTDRDRSELLIVVTPRVVDPLNHGNGVRVGDTLPILPDTTLPAREAIKPRLQDGAVPVPPGD